MRRVSVALLGMTVVLLACAALGVAQPNPNAAPVPVPGLQLPKQAGQMYLATRDVNPGVVLHVSAAGEAPVFTRPASNLTSLTFGRTPKGVQAEAGVMSLIFCNAISQKSIWRATSPATEAMLTGAREYIREVAFGPGGGLYYSHSSGAAADGQIMVLAGAAPTLYTKIEIAKIGGFWAGNFAFDPDGKLYVSNGNMGGARIWAYPPGGAPAPSVVFKTTGSILGFWFTDATNFLYTDGSARVFKGHIGGSGPDGAAYESRAQHRFCDVVIR